MVIHFIKPMTNYSNRNYICELGITYYSFPSFMIVTIISNWIDLISNNSMHTNVTFLKDRA